MTRHDGRLPDELRTVDLTRGYTTNAAGSVLIQTGNTMVLCTASWETSVPSWREGSGSGWVTAEYDMLPASTSTRRRRNRLKVDGRTQEIQRLVGRSLRCVVDLDGLGENSILIDCDVLQADGGTRTASITAAYVALCDAVELAIQNQWIKHSPVKEAVAAVSVGKVDGRFLADLDYQEDSLAEVDMNVVMTASGRFVEVQGTGEGAAFDRTDLEGLLDLAALNIRKLLEIQKKTLSRRLRKK